jgi:hypothetical protein
MLLSSAINGQSRNGLVYSDESSSERSRVVTGRRASGLAVAARGLLEEVVPAPARDNAAGA